MDKLNFRLYWRLNVLLLIVVLILAAITHILAGVSIGIGFISVLGGFFANDFLMLLVNLKAERRRANNKTLP
jgi:hypothetical protein